MSLPLTPGQIHGIEKLLVTPVDGTELVNTLAKLIYDLGVTRLTAARAGYLDSFPRILCAMDFWSIPQIAVVLPAVAANQALPDVVVAALPTGAVVVRATAIFKYRCLQNAGLANALNGGQHIQIQKGGAGGYADAVSMVTGQFVVAAAAVDAPGDVVQGNINVVAKVSGNDTYNFQWTNANANVAGLTFTDCQMGIRIWYSV